VNRNGLFTRIAACGKLGQGALLFILHQFIGTVGIVILASYLTAYVFDVIGLFGKTFPSAMMYRLLTGTPYYPIQFSLGLSLGWLIGWRVQHRAMLWVWILPFVNLTYAVIAIPTLVPKLIPPAYQAGIGESRWTHYFGWGCGGHPCFDQPAITLLFYVSVVYSIGAFLARRVPRLYPSSNLRGSWGFLAIGFVFLFVAVLELVRVIQHGWEWIYLGPVMMPGIAAFLMLYAATLRRSRLTPP
jgi:hypothetical protein